MTSWATITMRNDAEKYVYSERKPPVELILDSGIDEYGRTAEGDFYGLSYGRYQKERFHQFARELACPKFSGITALTIAEMNDTGDSVEVHIYRPKQRNFDSRVDGYEEVYCFEGELWPNEKQEVVKEEVKAYCGVEPLIEPKATDVPPDAVIRK